VRLLRAELRKLRRPLVVWTALALLGFCCLLAWGGASSAAREFQTGQAVGFPSQCAEIGVPEGPECERQLAEIRAEAARFEEEARRELREVKSLHHPVGVGRLVAGLLASFPGAVAIFLLAAGHVGQEWSGHTIKTVLTQDGRRWRLLAAKIASLWLLGAALLGFVWAGLAAFTPMLSAFHELPVPAPSLAQAWDVAGEQAARALLVLAAFATVGTLAAVLTRNTLGAFFLAFAFLVVSFVLFNFASLTRGTITYWVLGWMEFRPQVYSLLPWHLWPDVLPPVRKAATGPEGLLVSEEQLPFPSHLAGLSGLAGAILASGLLALLRFWRSDVKA
jgi:ABC-type transport system involved in multi-copper enzyme maturation permease subunit